MNKGDTGMNTNMKPPAALTWDEYLNKYDPACEIANIFDVAGDVFAHTIRGIFLQNVHKYNGIVGSLEGFLKIAGSAFDNADDKLMALTYNSLKVLNSERKNWESFWKDVARAMCLEDEFFEFFWAVCGEEGVVIKDV